ncbi:hypothetical protein ABBQ38_013205 [Trebouxia sp. C0009 RCD-2024]
MAPTGMISTPAEPNNFYPMRTSKNGMAASSVGAVNIATITFVPAGHSLACMPRGFILDKAGSLRSLSPKQKPTGQLTATLLLLARATKHSHAKRHASQVHHWPLVRCGQHQVSQGRSPAH